MKGNFRKMVAISVCFLMFMILSISIVWADDAATSGAAGAARNNDIEMDGLDVLDAGQVEAGTIVDRDDHNYTVDPNGVSRFNRARVTASPSSNNDVPNKKYVDDYIAALHATINNLESQVVVLQQAINEINNNKTIMKYESGYSYGRCEISLAELPYDAGPQPGFEYASCDDIKIAITELVPPMYIPGTDYNHGTPHHIRGAGLDIPGAWYTVNNWQINSCPNRVFDYMTQNICQCPAGFKRKLISGVMPSDINLQVAEELKEKLSHSTFVCIKQ